LSAFADSTPGNYFTFIIAVSAAMMHERVNAGAVSVSLTGQWLARTISMAGK